MSQRDPKMESRYDAALKWPQAVEPIGGNDQRFSWTEEVGETEVEFTLCVITECRSRSLESQPEWAVRAETKVPMLNVPLTDQQGIRMRVDQILSPVGDPATHVWSCPSLYAWSGRRPVSADEIGRLV